MTIYRGEAITKLVKEAAALVTEANGFDSDEGVALGCRAEEPRLIAMDVSRHGEPFVVRSASDPCWLRWVAEGKPRTYGSNFENVPDRAGQPANMRDSWIGD